MTQYVNSAFLPDQSVLNFRSTATLHGCSAAYAILPRPAYESFWTSKAIFETSHNHQEGVQREIPTHDNPSVTELATASCQSADDSDPSNDLSRRLFVVPQRRAGAACTEDG